MNSSDCSHNSLHKIEHFTTLQVAPYYLQILKALQRFISFILFVFFGIIQMYRYVLGRLLNAKQGSPNISTIPISLHYTLESICYYSFFSF